MSGQTFRENVAQDLTNVLEQHFGTAWGEEEWALHQALVVWAVERFGGHAIFDGDGNFDAAAAHLNEAIRAVYANIGPSPVLVEIRAAMEHLGMTETNRRLSDG